MSDLSLENYLRPKEGRYREILSDKEHDVTNTKQEITKWLITIYNDAKEMGLELQSVEYYIEIAKQALEANDWGKALTYANRSINTMVTLAETCAPELNLKKINGALPLSIFFLSLFCFITSIPSISVKILFAFNRIIKGVKPHCCG